jgi:Mn-dependent DtxR family transcriptional regulator
MSFEEKQLKLLPDVSFAGKIQGMERQLKDNQMRTLRFIYDYIKNNDCAPARKEVAEALGVSLSAAYDRTQHLFGHGYLRESGTRQYGRNIALTEKGIRACEGDE